MGEQRQCAGCGDIIPDEAETVALKHMIIALGRAQEIEMGINSKEQQIISPDTFICAGSPECGASWIKKQLAGIG